MDRITFTIKGAKEMENLLKQLGPAVARRVGTNALRSAAKIVVDEAKRLAPVGKGKKKIRLKTAIRAELWGTGKNSSSLLIKVGAARPYGSHAHLLEYGHHSYNQYGGPYTFVAARPFLRPAMDSRAKDALDRLGEVLGNGIDAQAKKLDKGRR